MLTPQEVSERAFPKASFGGYHMAQVDEFLDVLTVDYTALYNENAVLKSKMKVLVEKVEEYRSTEEAMRKALMTAQRMSDDLVQEAREKSEAMLRGAKEEAEMLVASISIQREEEEFRLASAQQETAAFVETVRAIWGKEEEYLNKLSELCPPPPSLQVDVVAETVSEIDSSVQRLVSQAMVEATAENLREQVQGESGDFIDTAEFPVVGEEVPEEGEDDGDRMSQTRRINFDNLQFGREYEIQ